MSNAVGGVFGWIDGVFRFAVGFFIGMALGYTTQFAAVTSWWFAAGTLVIVTIFILLMLKTFLAIDGVVQRFFDWAGGVKYPGGIKPPKNPAPEPKQHWFIRFGWVLAVVLGAV